MLLSLQSYRSSGQQQRVPERGKSIPFVAPEELQKDTLKQRTVLLFIIVVEAAGFTCLQRDDGRIPGIAVDSIAPRSDALKVVTQWIDELLLTDKAVPFLAAELNYGNSVVQVFTVPIREFQGNGLVACQWHQLHPTFAQYALVSINRIRMTRDTLTRLGEWPLEAGSVKRRKLQFVESEISMGVTRIQELDPDIGLHEQGQDMGIQEPRYIGLLRRAVREQERLVQLMDDVAVDHVLYEPLQAWKQCLFIPSLEDIPESLLHSIPDYSDDRLMKARLPLSSKPEVTAYLPRKQRQGKSSTFNPTCMTDLLRPEAVKRIDTWVANAMEDMARIIQTGICGRENCKAQVQSSIGVRGL